MVILELNDREKKCDRTKIRHKRIHSEWVVEHFYKYLNVPNENEIVVGVECWGCMEYC